MTDVNAAFAAAVDLHNAGDFPGAERAYRDILAAAGSHAPTLCNLGALLVRAGDTDGAEQQYHLALATTPNYPDAHFNLGNLYRRLHQLPAAGDHYRACLAASPRHASAAYNLGLVYAAQGELAAAVEAFRTVTTLEPTNSDAHTRLGDALVRAGQLNDGIVAFRRGSALAPTDVRALYNLGLALANAGLTAEAQECLQKALRIKPDYAEAHNAMGLNLETIGRKDDALFHYQKAVELKPDLADAWSNLGTSVAEQGRSAEAIGCLRESLSIRPDAAPIHSNLLLLLNYGSDLTPTEVAAEHRAWAAKFTPPCPPRPPIPEPHDPDRRLRIGYLSSDFRAHTLSGFIATLLTHHDRDRVEVFAYASILRPDDVTAKLEGLADHWRMIGGVPDERVFRQMIADQLDVLVDLNGHTAGNRLMLLANRPAPVQLTLFGYPNTTGVQAIDYRVTDGVSEPPGMTEDFSVERLLRLPEVPWVYAPPGVDVPVTPLPALQQKQFTFGCLNNPAKISDACLGAWAKLMQSVLGTKLAILAGPSQASAKRLGDRFVRAGILRERIELLPRLSKEKYFEAYQQFDVALDPFPYNGGVTTGDAMWMGVPVLAVAGNSYASRQGVMANAAVGLPEFTARSADDLVALAKSWTQRRPELTAVRAGLRERLLMSPLGDGPRYVANLEAAYRQAWRDALAGGA